MEVGMRVGVDEGWGGSVGDIGVGVSDKTGLVGMMIEVVVDISVARTGVELANGIFTPKITPMMTHPKSRDNPPALTTIHRILFLEINWALFTSVNISAGEFVDGFSTLILSPRIRCSKAVRISRMD